MSEHANVCDTYIVRFFQSRANETVVSELGPLPAQMQSPHIYHKQESVSLFTQFKPISSSLITPRTKKEVFIELNI